MTDPTTTNENSGSNTANPARDLFEHAANAAYYANHPHPRGYSPWEEKQARRATTEVMNAIGEYLLRDYISKTDADLRDIAFRLSNNVADPQVKIAKLLLEAARASNDTPKKES